MTERPKAIASMPAADLALLKSQLQSAMGQVSRREKVLQGAAERATRVPQTVAQVDALEKLLSDALDELRTRRAELQKTAKTQPVKEKKDRIKK